MSMVQEKMYMDVNEAMGVYKEGKNWKVQVYYKDWQGNRKRKQKRGFRTKGEACNAVL